MGKSTRPQPDPFGYKPEYNNQVGTPTLGNPQTPDAFSFKPEYNQEVKKKPGGGALQSSSQESAPTPSTSQLAEEPGVDFLVKDIESNDFFNQLARQTDQYFLPTTIARENAQMAEFTKQEVFRNPNSLQKYNDTRIKLLNDKVQDLERQKLDYGTYVSAGVGAKPTFSIENKTAYNQIEQEIRGTKSYIDKLKESVADVATEFVMRTKDVTNFNPVTAGREIMRIADPELENQFKLAEKGGGTLPGIRRSEIERVGLTAAKNYINKNPQAPNSAELAKLASEYEIDFDKRNFELTGQRVREKIGAELYKSGKSGFWGYSPDDLDKAAIAAGLSAGEQNVFETYVKPIERKKLGTDIPGSGFFRSFKNAFEKSIVGTGKTIGDITGARDESEVAQELLNQEVEESRFRAPGESGTAKNELAFLRNKEKADKLTDQEKTKVIELEKYVDIRNGWSKFKDGVGDLTGQVAMMALATKGIGGIGRALQASGASGGLLGGLTRSTVGTALSNETVGLFVNSYLSSYDNYLKQGIALMPGEDQAAERDAYAKTMAAVEGLSEQIFKDTKILKAFSGKVAPSVQDIAGRFINKEITQQVAKEELQGTIQKYMKGFGKEYLKSTGQEATEEAIVDLADGMAQSIYGGQPFDISKTGQQALNTFITTALYSPLVAGMAAHGAYRQNSSQNAFFKSSLFNIGANPAEYLKAVEDLHLSGGINQQEVNEKVKLIKSASQYLQEIPSNRTVIQKVGENEVQEQVPMDYPQINTYLLHRLNEGIIQQKIDNSTDEVINSQLTKELNRSQEIRKGIFDGSIAVTPDLNEVTDNPEKAEELGISTTMMPEKVARETILNPETIQNAVNQSLRDMREEPLQEEEAGIMPTMSQRIYEKLAEDPLFNTDPEIKRQLPQLLQRIFKERGVEEKELRNMSESELTNASRGLYEAIRGEMAVQGMSFKSSQGKKDSATPLPTESETVSEEPNAGNKKNPEKIIQNAIDAGKMPGVFEEVAKNDPEQFFKFVADQAFGRDEKGEVIKGTEAEKDVRKNYGDELVDYAKELFPITQNTQQNEEVSQKTIPEEASTSEEGGGQQEQNAGQENDEEGDVLTEQGALPDAEAPLSGITQAKTEEDRKEFGLGDSYEKTPVTDKELEDQAIEEIKKGYNIEELITKLEKGVDPNPLETVILKKYKASLEAEIKKNPTDKKLAEMLRLVKALDAIGSLQGRSFRLRKGLELRDDSIASYFVREQEASGLTNLTNGQKDTVQKEFSEIQDAQKAYDEKIAKLEEENANLRAEQEIKKAKTTTKKVKKSHQDYVQERKEIIEQAKDKLKKLRGNTQVTIIPYANQLFTIAPEVGKVMKSLVEEGVSNLQDVVQNLQIEFKTIVPELTKNDVRQIIAGDYNEKRPLRSELAKRVRDLQDEAKLIGKLEALQGGEEPKNEKNKIKRNQQIEALRQQIKDNDLTKLAQNKTRINAEINKLEKQLKSGDFAPDEKKPSLKLDKETIAIKDKLIKLHQEREIRLLRLEYEKRTKREKSVDAIANVLNVPRSLMSSLDFSAPLRQSAILTVSNPKSAVIAGAEMFKQAFSQKRFDRWFFDLQQTPRYQLMQQSKLYVANPLDPRLTIREEQFMSNLAEKIPLIGKLVKGSERAYVSYLNKMRVDLFNRYADAFENDGITWDNKPDMYTGLASFLNNSTGRGDLGAAETSAPILNSMFFSPRLIASRLNILGLGDITGGGYYSKLPPKIRKEALKSLAIFIGAGISTLALLKYGYPCKGEDDNDCIDVEIDPRSSDFGKIRSGKTRWDIWAGFQQYIRIISQLVSGETKSANSGAIQELNGKSKFGKTRGDVLSAFARGKLAPVPSFIVERLEGRNVLGEKQTLQESIAARLLPLVASDLYGSIKENGVKAIFTQGIPSTFGIGVQTYLPKGYEDKNMKDPTYKFLYDKNINISRPEQKESQSEKEYEQFIKERDVIVKEKWDEAIQYGVMINKNGNPTIDEDAAVELIPANKATYEQLTGLMKSISTKASRDVNKQKEE